MQTVTAAIGERIEALRGLLFLLEHSGSLRDINKSSDSIVFVGPHYAWGDLDQEGRRLQSRLLDDYRRLAALIRALLKTLPAESVNEVERAENELEELIDQSLWVPNIRFRLEEGSFGGGGQGRALLCQQSVVKSGAIWYSRA